MGNSILIRGARQLLTLHGPNGLRRGPAMHELGIITDGAVLIRDGRIDEVGPSRRVEALARARGADEISASGRVVMPGFVDSHTHLIAGPIRVSDCPGELPAEAYWKPLQHTSRHTLEAQGIRSLAEFVRHGTTTLEAATGFGVSALGEVKILRVHRALNQRTSMLVSTFMGTRWHPPEGTTDEYVDWMCGEMLPLVKQRGLAEFANICCERDLFSIEQARRYLTTARHVGLIPKMHATRTSEAGAIPEAVHLGAASVNLTTSIHDTDLDALAGSHTIATLLPGPVFFSGHGRFAGARRMIDRGVAVALGTDCNPETCPSENMQMMIALGCRVMGMTAAEAISAATINGAYALRRGSRVGSLQHDKVADIVILDVPDYREISHHFGVNLVETTIKNGRAIWHRGNIRWPALPEERADRAERASES